MRQRRVMAAASAVVLALGMAACGGSDKDDTASTAGKLEGTGPITFVTGKDTSGNRQNQVNGWNKTHPNEQARLIELPEQADQQRQQMVVNAQTKSDQYSVLNLDVVWTGEFAANGWIDQLPESEFPLDTFLPATVETGKYFKKLYAIPLNSDGGLLYYRKDLLDAAGVTAPPKTWAEMKTACDAVLKLPAAKGAGCYAGQFDKYEGLTVNFSEAVNSAGGQVVDEDGKPNVNTPEAKKGLQFLVDGFKSGEIPAKALTFKEEEGRRAFQAGQLVFHRQWPYIYAKANATDGSSKVAGKFAVAPLPGESGPGVSTLGGHNLAISKFTKNKKSALDFIKYITSADVQKADLQATSQAPTIASLYDDASLTEKFPYLPTLKASIEGAKKRPEAVKYQEVSTAIQGAAYDALKGSKSPDDALSGLQSSLEGLMKK
jgi:multiple sugar transport system substrate-binding protein